MTEETTATESAESATITLGEAPAETAEDTFVPREPAAPVHGWWWGTGRRKASVARVRVQPGSAGVLCNGKPLEEYFCTPRDRNSVMAITLLRSRGVQKYSSKGLPLQSTPALPGCTLTRATEALRRPVPHHHPWTGAAGSRGTKVSSAVSAGASPKVMVADSADSVAVVSSVIRKVFQ